MWAFTVRYIHTKHCKFGSRIKQAIYSLIAPGWFSTFVYGNDHFLFRSAYFWLCLPLTIILSLAPRYLFKAWKSGFAPDDLDIMRYIRKVDPQRDVAHEVYQAGGNKGLAAMKRTPSVVSQSHSRLVASSRASSFADIEGPTRPSFDPRTRSRTDMSTGLRSVHRGFDFAEEEGGVAMRRMQTNLSEVRNSTRNLPATSGTQRGGRRQLSHVFTIRRGLLKRKSAKKDD